MSLSESASAQVQAILQAAESSAEQIKREAQAEADRIRAAARETRQADVSGLYELVAKVRADLDALEARLKGIGEAEQQPGAEAPKEPAEAKAAEAKPAAAAAGDDDAESARLIALNMALNGESREAVDSYLAENYDLADRAALLDEVYANVEG